MSGTSEEKPSVIAKAELEAMPRAVEPRHIGTTFLRAPCHPRLSATSATYHDGVVTLRCSVCGTIAHRIRVAEGAA